MAEKGGMKSDKVRRCIYGKRERERIGGIYRILGFGFGLVDIL